MICKTYEAFNFLQTNNSQKYKIKKPVYIKYKPAFQTKNHYITPN